MLHWNIHSWRDDAGAPNHAAVAGLIRETAPDVVSLVEVRESWGAPSALGGLAGELGYHWGRPHLPGQDAGDRVRSHTPVSGGSTPPASSPLAIRMPSCGGSSTGRPETLTTTVTSVPRR